MMRFIAQSIISAISLILVSKIVPGVTVENFQAALIAGIILGFLMRVIRPVLSIVSLPVTIMTFGLFSFVLSGLLFALAGYFTPGFSVSGLLPAIVGSIVFGLITSFFSWIISKQ